MTEVRLNGSSNLQGNHGDLKSTFGVGVEAVQEGGDT